jgi:hypothetical protein
MTGADVSTTEHPARTHHPLANRCVLALLRSPAHGLLDPGLCELSYHARRSGRRVALPVMFAESGARLVVLVGDAPGKTWWRNFRTPGPVRVLRGGVVRPGVARMLAPGDTGYPEAVAAYDERHGIRPVPTDRVVVIDPS